jgi:hypothetical protein
MPPVDACVVAAELCNGTDDDCDGRADEDFDLQTSLQHCGACNAACASDPANGSFSCAAGMCVLGCDPRFGNCDSNDDNGCEASLATAVNCGACGTACPVAEPFCEVSGASASCVSTCSLGTTMCGDACADLQTDVTNCGTCDNVCPTPANATATCTGGTCAFDCDGGFADCDGDAPGCETMLGTTAACSGCGDVCAAPNTIPSCISSACDYMCMTGFGDCDGSFTNGCETGLTTIANCGGCGTVCSDVHAAPMCASAMCSLGCDYGWGDCDSNPSTGCELALTASPNCGGCGTTCSSGNECHGAECIGPCGSGTTCGGGCESGCSCGSGTCRFGCGDACAVTCDATCLVHAQNRDTVNVTCNDDDDCTVYARDARMVRASCTGNDADCDVDCRGVDDCVMTCDNMADCLLRCGSGSGTCTLSCSATTYNCGGGVYICSRSCP